MGQAGALQEERHRHAPVLRSKHFGLPIIPLIEGADVEDDPYYARAKWVCSICPVRLECRDYADRVEKGQKRLFGVIGGEDSFERRARREKEGKL